MLDKGILGKKNLSFLVPLKSFVIGNYLFFYSLKIPKSYN